MAIKERIRLRQYSLVRIPYKINEYNLIKDIHIKSNHRCYEDTRKEVLKLKYYYYRFINDIKYIISKFRICTVKNKNLAKIECFKPIIFNSPRDRYILDLSQIPYFIDVNTNKKNFFNIIKLFSKQKLFIE